MNTPLNNLNFIKIATVTPKVDVANPEKNVAEIIKNIDIAYKNKAKVVVFPELSLTGYTCADIFHQDSLMERTMYHLFNLKNESAKYPEMLIVVGAPIRADNQLFNCAIVIQDKKIKGIVPKTFLPSYNEFYERRWFSSSRDRISKTIEFMGEEIPFGEYLLFKDACSNLCCAIDVCEDLWCPIPPSTYHTMYGANLILNLSASNETISKASYRRDIVVNQSAKCVTAYAYCSAGQTESTTDLVFSGHNIIAENGTILNEVTFEEESIIYADIDVNRLIHDRTKQTSYMGIIEKKEYQVIPIRVGYSWYSMDNKPLRKIKRNPFVPSENEIDSRHKEILNLQVTGLYQRMKKINSKKAIIGISGGLDSTLALIVVVEAFKKLGYSNENIIGVTMPGFGTTKRTLNNSLDLMNTLGITVKNIDITKACLQHFEDIGHDANVTDITYENVQARERTQILMDLANKLGGLVIGTGDLSELALGWCTYNGDHMSMYGVNASVPKTLVKYIIKGYASLVEDSNPIKEILFDICDTPISPELLPPDKNGDIAQKTEESIGSYDINDFFLYHTLRNGFSAEKIFDMVLIAFDDVEREVLLNTLKNFYKRFFTQQFKRSCLPDGVKVGSICLSPRGDWRCPSDLTYESIMSQIKNLK